MLATWDPHTHPVITEVAGVAKFSDFVEGVTVKAEVDDITGLTDIVITDHKARGAGTNKDLRPMGETRRQGRQGRQLRGAPRFRRTTSCRRGAIVGLQDG